MTFSRSKAIPGSRGRAATIDDPGALVLKTRRLFPERLRMMRARADLSQTALARHIYVAQHTVSNWENGLYQPKMVDIVLICEVLDCSADYLLGKHVDP